MTLDEFQTLLARIDVVSNRLEQVSSSLTHCQTLCEARRVHRMRWSDRIWGAIVVIASGITGWLVRKYQ